MHTTAVDAVPNSNLKPVHHPGNKPTSSAVGSPVIQTAMRQRPCINSMEISPQLQANAAPHAHTAATTHCKPEQGSNQHVRDMGGDGTTGLQPGSRGSEKGTK